MFNGLKSWAFLLACAALLNSFALAAEPVPGAKHPVAQLVEWELNSNSEMRKDALERMATVILERVDASEFSEPVRNALPSAAFRAANPVKRAMMLKAAPASVLKEIVIHAAPIEFFEFPEKELLALEGKYPHEMNGSAAQLARQYVRFEKDGVPHVRWFIHPLADSRASKIATILKGRYGIEPKPTMGDTKFHFTSSRSLVLFDGDYDHAISMKASLPAAEGPFKNKEIHLKEFSAWSRLNKYISSVVPGGRTENMVLQHEPYGLGMKVGPYEDAFLFRDLSELTSEKKYLLPAFAVLNEKTGAAIAKLNGSDDPLKFWEKNLIEPLAKGMAELRAQSGAEHTSAHSQNLLVELDERMKPTGKVVLRDFDFYIDAPVLKKLNNAISDVKGVAATDGKQYHTFALRNGLQDLPSWMTEADYGRLTQNYFDTYRARFNEVVGLPPDRFWETSIMKADDGALTGLSPVKGPNDFKQGFRANFHMVRVANDPDAWAGYERWLSGQPVGEIPPRPAKEPPPRVARAPVDIEPPPPPVKRGALAQCRDFFRKLAF
ncbi:MAG: hypothetical protein EOP11_04245 [Proteobacteria bacterium]|nr:MAG: hypothetical protein EOP11_04245 [Pseudomonadota bacterium]